MTPQDENVHEFIVSMNQYRQCAREYLLRDVPMRNTDEFKVWERTADSLCIWRDALRESFQELLEEI